MDYPIDSIIEVIHNDVTAEVIIARVLNNLIIAYSFIDDVASINFFTIFSKKIPNNFPI